MTNRKTFRLFISSTFDDFRREREVLQTKVFPHIKQYCSKLGYTFQPIDLRWGVSNEAQLDQKTLELCLNEVRSCKSYPYPNFLIMIGDRYGWIPLPYIIEKTEFEALLSLMSQEEVDKMKIWYKEDLNQLPASYILKERKGEFESFEVWNKVEEDLRSILQITANKSMLSKEQKRKYFLSATEAEVEEGIIPYLKPTKHQKILIQEKPELLSHDANNIFGFFRDIDIKTKKSEKFITSDFVQAQTFKKRVKIELSDENILHSQTTQFSESTLDKQYLTQFVNKTISFLKRKLDEQKDKEKNDNFSPLDLEIEAQNYFAQQKRENFIGQESLLQRIETYINNDNPQPLVIYGESGKGKSSLIAKAVEEAKKNGKKKVISRFIGATAHSSSTKEILTSIFSELGIDVRSEEDKRENSEEISIQNFDDKRETFEQFSYRIYDEILCLKDDVTIFIDAVDQLSNNDQFLWLPNNLPHNVKIIISALSDERYEEDSKYFEKLKTKTKNIALIKPFEKPVSLLKSLLRKEYRTIQKHQEEYFLKQFEKSASPFYVFVAALEMKYWKSFDLVAGQDETKNRKLQNLADSQYGIIYEFIENLSTIYHHEKKLVQKVLGYIFASQDGLSESEILELLSIDEDFVKQMAPDTWHDNLNKVLPLVIWTRLYASLKPFLSLKQQDGEELLYFFHREFEDMARDNPNLEHEYENIVFATQKLITKYQHDYFYSNRWGKIYILLLSKHLLLNDKRLQIWSEFIYNINAFWIHFYLNDINAKGNYFSQINNTDKALMLRRSSLHSSSILYFKNNKSGLWKDYYFNNLINLALTYNNLNRINEAIELNKKALGIVEILYKTDSTKWTKSYLIILQNLSLSLNNLNKLDEAIVLGQKALNISEELFLKTSDEWIRIRTKSLINLGIFYKEIGKVFISIELEENAVNILGKKYIENPTLWSEQYIDVLSNLTNSYGQINNTNLAIENGLKLKSICETLYKNNPIRWSEYYIRSLGNLAINYSKIEDVDQTLEMQQMVLDIVERMYDKNPERWAEFYIISLNNLIVSYNKSNDTNQAFKAGLKASIILEQLYETHPDVWADDYVLNLINLTESYLAINKINEAIWNSKKAKNICEDLYNVYPERWARYYILSLQNLGLSFSKGNQFNKAIEVEKKKGAFHFVAKRLE